MYHHPIDPSWDSWRKITRFIPKVSRSIPQKLRWRLLENHLFFIGDTSSSSWWLNQPPWKICSSNWVISPGRDENKKSLSCHHPDLHSWVFFYCHVNFWWCIIKIQIQLDSSTYKEQAPHICLNRILAFMPMLAGHNKIVETKQNILPPCIYVYAQYVFDLLGYGPIFATAAKRGWWRASILCGGYIQYTSPKTNIWKSTVGSDDSFPIEIFVPFSGPKHLWTFSGFGISTLIVNSCKLEF